MKKNILFIIICVICTTSCLYKDLGNYEYDRFSEFKISEIELDYGVKELFKDTLKINPIVEFENAPDEDFKFEWYIDTKSSLIKISDEKNLVFMINQKGDPKTGLNFRFVVTHKKTGLLQKRSTKCTIITKSEKGWYILKEIDGKTEVDGVFRLTDTTYYDPMENIIKAIRGESIDGIPVALDYSKYRWTNSVDSLVSTQCLYIASNKDMAVLDLAELKFVGTYEEVFGDGIAPVEERSIEGMYTGSGGTAILIYDGGKLRSKASDNSDAFYPEYAEFDYKMHYKAISAYIGSDMMVYDELTSTFYTANYRMTGLTRCSDSGGAFKGVGPMGRLNSKMLYFGSSIGSMLPPAFGSNGIGYALLEKKTDADSVLLCQIELGLYDKGMSVLCDPMQRIDTLSASKDSFVRSEHFSAHLSGGRIYYSLKNKIGIYYITDKTRKDAIKDFSGEEVTWLKHVRVGNVNGLAIATYKNGRYKLMVYEMLVGGTELVEKPFFKTEGEGKIVMAKYLIPGGGYQHTYF